MSDKQSWPGDQSTDCCRYLVLLIEAQSIPQAHGSRRALALWRQEGYCFRPHGPSSTP